MAKSKAHLGSKFNRSNILRQVGSVVELQIRIKGVRISGEMALNHVKVSKMVFKQQPRGGDSNDKGIKQISFLNSRVNGTANDCSLDFI